MACVTLLTTVLPGQNMIERVWLDLRANDIRRQFWPTTTSENQNEIIDTFHAR
jgi:hypothetical protein